MRKFCSCNGAKMVTLSIADKQFLQSTNPQTTRDICIQNTVYKAVLYVLICWSTPQTYKRKETKPRWLWSISGIPSDLRKNEPMLSAVTNNFEDKEQKSGKKIYITSKMFGLQWPTVGSIQPWGGG